VRLKKLNIKVKHVTYGNTLINGKIEKRNTNNEHIESRNVRGQGTKAHQDVAVERLENDLAFDPVLLHQIDDNVLQSLDRFPNSPLPR